MSSRVRPKLCVLASRSSLSGASSRAQAAAGTTSSLKPYLDCVRASLDAALCIRNFASQTVERHNKPEVEDRESAELLLRPVVISRSEKERVLIEPSINSVRVSITIKQADDMEKILAARFTRFLMQRAEQFVILRRKPCKVRRRPPGSRIERGRKTRKRLKDEDEDGGPGAEDGRLQPPACPYIPPSDLCRITTSRS